MTIKSKYEAACAKPSDINEHLPTLLKYANKVKHITEMGVRDVVSTWAFLMAQPDRLVCIDIVRSDNITEMISIASIEKRTHVTFTKADTTKMEIEETDLLFIDTLHTYSQLKNELKLHADKVRKYIIFHDVVTYGHKPEPSSFDTHKGKVWQAPEVLANYKDGDKGLLPAIQEFLEANPNWNIVEHCLNNNGLMIIERNG